MKASRTMASVPAIVACAVLEAACCLASASAAASLTAASNHLLATGSSELGQQQQQQQHGVQRELLQDDYDIEDDFNEEDEVGGDYAYNTPTGSGSTTSSSSSSTGSTSTEGTAATGAAGAAGTQQQQEAAAQKSTRTKALPSSSKVVEFAPAANITFGDDVDDEGKCKAEIEKFCKEVDEGEGKLADCLSDAIAHSENPETGDNAEDVPVVSDDCREEVYQYKISRSTNINKNIPLAKACKADAEKLCNVTWFFGYKEGQVISCLREYKSQLGKKCKRQVTKAQRDAAEDIRADPTLWEACKEDAKNYCKGTKFGGGRVQACLRENRMKLTWTCDEQLFRQEIENADDIRLSVRLFSRCMPDKRKFCKDVEPGNARAKDCLEEHRQELSSGCRTEVDAMIERRSRDFRLDSKLRNACESEITNMCAYFGDLDDIDTYDSSVINCLQDYSAEIKNDECKRQVKKYLVLAAQDIRFDLTLAEACYDDRTKYCANVPPGSARVIRCMTRQREKLSPVCRATLFDEEVRFSENIDFQYPMKEACQAELTKFCKDVPHEHARAIRCLQDNKNEKGFGKPCREEVVAYEAEISKDYRLNYRLNKNCAKDISVLCNNLCALNDGNVCSGKVLRCLTDKVDEVKSEDCRKEVFYFQKMEVENFQNDIILAEACRNDVEQFCGNVEPGEGRVHKCLRDNRKKLSEQCRKEELLLEEKEASNIELSQGLLRACKAERQLFCRDVKPGSARVFRCLAENMNDADFGPNCKFQVVYKLQRRQSNWKLDPPLRKACRKDVAQLCSTEDEQNTEQGLVYKCLIKNVANIAPACQRELSRAVHMALYAWQPGAILTSDCDDDIAKYCLAARPNMQNRPGAIGSCLASILERQDQSTQRISRGSRALAEEAGDGAAAGADTLTAAAPGIDPTMLDDGVLPDSPSTTNFKALQGAKLTDKCYMLADIAEPPNMKQAFDASLSFALLKSQLDKIDRATGLSLVTRNAGGRAEAVSLTGWVAMLGVTSMVLLVAYGGFVAYKRFRGIPDNPDGYTLVVKSSGK